MKKNNSESSPLLSEVTLSPDKRHTPLSNQYDHLDDSAQHIKRGSVAISDTVSSKFSFRKLWQFTGPGFLMSIAYIDPGNLESDLQAGAQGGYSLLWVLWWCTIIGMFLQLLSARLGVVTGMNLAQICRTKYSPVVRYTLWIMMEIAIISSDIQEVIGSALAINILSDQKIPLYGGVLITGVDTFTFLLLERYGLRKLEALFAVLITTMSITFGYMFYSIQDSGDLSVKDVALATLVPSVPKGTVTQAIGILGAVIMPHNLYLHSALVNSRKIDTNSTAKIKEANFYYAIETGIALFVSFLINMFVLAVFAAGFTKDFDGESKCDNFLGHVENACRPENIDLARAGCCLGVRFSEPIKIIWAIGLLAAGQSSTMTGTYAGQFVMEGFLAIKVAPWKRVLLTRTCAMVPTIAVALYAKPSTLGSLDEWMNVLQAFQLPFALVPLLHFTAMPAIMGKFSNGIVTKWFGWILSLVVIVINYELVSSLWELSLKYLVPISIMTIVYTLFVLYLIAGPWWKRSPMGRWYSTSGDDSIPINVYSYE